MFFSFYLTSITKHMNPILNPSNTTYDPGIYSQFLDIIHNDIRILASLLVDVFLHGP
jgi:hypothetical protein